MAKTRIKTTPTRMQKEALIASAAVSTTNSNNVTEHVLKKRLTAFNHSMLIKEAIPTAVQSTIIVQPPKRTNSISSATSTISHTSDGHSSLESPPPLAACSAGSTIIHSNSNSNGPTMAELTENAIKTLNAGLMAKSSALALKNRKVYMITEKCDDSNIAGTTNNAGGVVGSGGVGTIGSCLSSGGQKRKMYLIMEEKESDVAEKLVKSECSNGSKKLTLFTDTANGQLPQKIEKILPEILNCIQAKGGGGVGGLVTTGGGGGSLVCGGNVAAIINGEPSASRGSNNDTECHATRQFALQDIHGKAATNDAEKSKIIIKSDKDKNERLPLTLPPKKNRTKIITTQIIPVNSATYLPPSQAGVLSQMSKSSEGGSSSDRGITTVYCTNGNGSRNGNGHDNYGKSDTSSATPVIVNANTLLSNGSNNNGTMKVNGLPMAPPQLHKNINLSTDFLFLMKMLPKLESIPEVHKNYVKNCIEDMINQYSTIDQEEEQ